MCARGVGRRYRSVWALRHCDLAVPSGTTAALVGPNGAGKTTLLRLAVGLLRPSEGAITVFGRDCTANTTASLASVGFVAQDHPLYRRFTISDLLRMGRCLNPSWDDRYARERLDTLGIALDRRAAELSGGQHAQVALTLALAKRPRLLVLDEPLASLDPLARLDFLRSLATAARDQGITVLFSSHVVSDLEQVCDFLIVLTDGEVRVADTLTTIVAKLAGRPGERGMVAATLHDVVIRYLSAGDPTGEDRRWGG